MASDGSPGKIPVANLLQGSQAVSSVGTQPSGKSLPPSGKTASEASVGGPKGAVKPADPASTALHASAHASAPRTADPQSLVNLLNKHLNDSGRPDQFRVDPASAGKLIQQINPSNGAVVGEFPVNEFPALARGIGASGLIVDSLA
jgi:hypothetical protein